MFNKQKHFPHRHNPDGSYDSTCAYCLVTIGSYMPKVVLEMMERSHVCDQTILAQEKVFMAHFKPSASPSRRCTSVPVTS